MKMQRMLTAAKAIADRNRLRILAALRKQELCVCELCDGLKIRQSTLSSQLRFLLNSHSVDKRMEGKWAYYSLNPEFRAVFSALFASYRSDLEGDQTLSKDQTRLRDRLALREGGNCCQGFACTKPKAVKAAPKRSYASKKTSR
jgi:ArsR family transcriptional regulator